MSRLLCPYVSDVCKVTLVWCSWNYLIRVLLGLLLLIMTMMMTTITIIMMSRTTSVIFSLARGHHLCVRSRSWGADEGCKKEACHWKVCLDRQWWLGGPGTGLQGQRGRGARVYLHECVRACGQHVCVCGGGGCVHAHLHDNLYKIIVFNISNNSLWNPSFVFISVDFVLDCITQSFGWRNCDLKIVSFR